MPVNSGILSMCWLWRWRNSYSVFSYLTCLNDLLQFAQEIIERPRIHVKVINKKIKFESIIYRFNNLKPTECFTNSVASQMILYDAN